MFKWLKQLKCTHWKANLESWSVISLNGVKVRYKCVDCGKDIYLVLTDIEATEWVESMGNHKKI